MLGLLSSPHCEVNRCASNQWQGGQCQARVIGRKIGVNVRRQRGHHKASDQVRSWCGQPECSLTGLVDQTRHYNPVFEGFVLSATTGNEELTFHKNRTDSAEAIIHSLASRHSSDVPPPTRSCSVVFVVHRSHHTAIAAGYDIPGAPGRQMGGTILQ
jgi:hypothetical protein